MWPLCKQCSMLRSFNAFVLVCNKSRFYPKWCISCLHSAQLICLWGPAPTRPIATEARRTLRNIFAAWIYQRHRVLIIKGDLNISFTWTHSGRLMLVICYHSFSVHIVQHLDLVHIRYKIWKKESQGYTYHTSNFVCCVPCRVVQWWCSTQMRNLTFLFVIRVTILIVLFGSGRPALL